MQGGGKKHKYVHRRKVDMLVGKWLTNLPSQCLEFLRALQGKISF